MMNCFNKADSNTLESLLNESATTVLFKHSNRCSISSVALSRLKDLCNDLKDGQKAILVDVIAQRELSNAIASKYQIQHESPQLIIIKDGEVVFHTSHLDITKDKALKYAS